jgi:hypothetical protein
MNGLRVNFSLAITSEADCDAPFKADLFIVGPDANENNVAYLPAGETTLVGPFRLSNVTATYYIIKDEGTLQDDIVIYHEGLYYDMVFDSGASTTLYEDVAQTFSFNH